MLLKIDNSGCIFNGFTGFDGGNGTEAEGEAGAQGRLGAEAAEPSSSSGNSSLPNIFFYRIIGNNMPPLQCPSQLLWNTQVSCCTRPSSKSFWDHVAPRPKIRGEAT